MTTLDDHIENVFDWVRKQHEMIIEYNDLVLDLLDYAMHSTPAHGEVYNRIEGRISKIEQLGESLITTRLPEKKE